MSISEVIRCKLTGVGSVVHGELQTNPTGRQTWIGVRVRTADGKTRFFPGMALEAEAAIILLAAMDRGETLELWLTGKAQRVYPYGIRTGTEEWYSDAFSRYLRSQAWKVLAFGIVTLPFFGMGILFMLIALSYFVASSTFAARHPRRTFELGYEAGVLGRQPKHSTVENLRAA